MENNSSFPVTSCVLEEDVNFLNSVLGKLREIESSHQLFDDVASMLFQLVFASLRVHFVEHLFVVDEHLLAAASKILSLRTLTVPSIQFVFVLIWVLNVNVSFMEI